MKVDFWGYDKIGSGMGSMGPSNDLHYGYGTMTCSCGNGMNIHEGSDGWCSSCGARYSLKGGSLTITLPKKDAENWSNAGNYRSTGLVKLRRNGTCLDLWFRLGNEYHFIVLPRKLVEEIANGSALDNDEIRVTASDSLAEIDKVLKGKKG